MEIRTTNNVRPLIPTLQHRCEESVPHVRVASNTSYKMAASVRPLPLISGWQFNVFSIQSDRRRVDVIKTDGSTATPPAGIYQTCKKRSSGIPHRLNCFFQPSCVISLYCCAKNIRKVWKQVLYVIYLICRDAWRRLGSRLQTDCVLYLISYRHSFIHFLRTWTRLFLS